MGEIADMMLDGTLCECCGEHIGRDAGYPQYCSPECAADRGALMETLQTPPAKPFACNLCDRRFGSDEARAQHRRDKHEETA